MTLSIYLFNRVGWTCAYLPFFIYLTAYIRACYSMTSILEKIMNRPDVSDEDLAKALIKYGGNISATARSFNKRRRYVSERIDMSEYLQSLKDDLRAEVIDYAEQNYVVKVMEGDMAASAFVLTTLGKDRGYTTRSELTGVGGASVFKGAADELARIIAEKS